MIYLNIGPYLYECRAVIVLFRPTENYLYIKANLLGKNKENIMLKRELHSTAAY